MGENWEISQQSYSLVRSKKSVIMYWGWWRGDKIIQLWDTSSSVKFKSDGNGVNLFGKVAQLSARINGSYNFPVAENGACFRAVNNNQTFLMNLSCITALSPHGDEPPGTWCCFLCEHTGNQSLACSEDLSMSWRTSTKMSHRWLGCCWNLSRSEWVWDASHHECFTPCLTAEPAVRVLQRVTRSKGCASGKAETILL